MLKYILLFLAFSSAIVVKGQTDSTEQKIHVFVKDMPHYKECENDTNKTQRTSCTRQLIDKFISENITLPKKKELQNGTVYVRFIVDKNGKVGNVEAVRSLNKNMDKCAIEVVKKLPQFIPGKNEKGEYVNITYIIPIKFSLN